MCVHLKVTFRLVVVAKLTPKECIVIWRFCYKFLRLL